MTRNFIPGLSHVDWSDAQRQNEFVNSLISALGALGERRTYDELCALSGCAFRTSFSMPGVCRWNHGNYHVINAPMLIDHAVQMLGYRAIHRQSGDEGADRQSIVDSIDRGVPAITVEGVIRCADACVISGYDQGGAVLLGYSPFMHVEDDHSEAPDDTGYFRKSDWHGDFFVKEGGRLVIFEGKAEPPDPEQSFAKTCRLIKTLIGSECLVPGQHNGLCAHRAFAHALSTYDWDDPFEPYLNTMCNYKQYLDRQYAVGFFERHGRGDLADCYREIAECAREMGRLIPQDFSAAEMFSDRRALAPYCDRVLRVEKTERRVLSLLP